MSRVSIAGAQSEPDQVEVDLWGATFSLKPATRKVIKASREIQQRFADSTDGDAADIYVHAVADLLDLVLTPEGGKRTKAATLIKRKWEADELSITQLDGFVAGIGAAGRPT